MTIPSPLTGNKTKTVATFQSKDIINGYEKYYGIDVKDCFEKRDKFSLKECLDTGYQFYYPYSLAGGDHFYQRLSNNNWYYRKEKWEHKASLKYIRPQNRVVEMGSATGQFIKLLNSEYIEADIIGLELNTEAVEIAKTQNLNVINADIIEYSKNHRQEADVVCSFQVFEHVPNVGEIIKAKLDLLKPFGRLIISVPNNDTFIQDFPEKSKLLNFPPHHMGRWRENSLKKLANFFNLELIDIQFEPLQPIHYDLFLYSKFKRLLRSKVLLKIAWKFRIHRLFLPLVRRKANQIKGHSILIVFQKPGIDE